MYEAAFFLLFLHPIIRNRMSSVQHIGDNHEIKKHIHSHERHSHGLVKNMFWAFIINACFTIVEFIGGIIFNSTAILTDAIHDLGDSIALGSSIFIEKKSYQDGNTRFTYGFRRLSILSGLINGIILLTGSVVMLFQAIDRIIEPADVNSKGMIGMAILGVIFNGLAVLRLKNSQKGLNARALYLHLLEDALGWVVLLIGAVVIYFYDVPILDPILSIGLCLFIGYNSFRLLIPVYHILMASTPKGINIESIKNEVEGFEGLDEIHDIHIWTLDGEYHILTAQLLVERTLNESQIKALKNQVVEFLRSLNILHTTLEVERLNNDFKA